LKIILKFELPLDCTPTKVYFHKKFKYNREILPITKGFYLDHQNEVGHLIRDCILMISNEDSSPKMAPLPGLNSGSPIKVMNDGISILCVFGYLIPPKKQRTV